MIYRAIKSSPGGRVIEGRKYAEFEDEIKLARDFGILEDFFELESVMVYLEERSITAPTKQLRQDVRASIGVTL